MSDTDDGTAEAQSDSDAETIEVSKKIRQWYDERKAKMDAADPSLPDMSNDQFMKCLLDTVEAVENGFYELSEGEEGTEAPRSERQPPTDARFCPSCGEALPLRAVRFYSDTLLDRYRAVFMCPECGYDGEVIRGGGIEDLSIHHPKSGSNRMFPVRDGDSDG